MEYGFAGVECPFGVRANSGTVFWHPFTVGGSTSIISCPIPVCAVISKVGITTLMCLDTVHSNFGNCFLSSSARSASERTQEKYPVIRAQWVGRHLFTYVFVFLNVHIPSFMYSYVVRWKDGSISLLCLLYTIEVGIYLLLVRLTSFFRAEWPFGVKTNSCKVFGNQACNVGN